MQKAVAVLNLRMVDNMASVLYATWMQLAVLITRCIADVSRACEVFGHQDQAGTCWRAFS